MECFNPFLPNLKRADAEDCQSVIDHILSSYGDPFVPHTFGYGSDVDIDLDEPENKKWAHGLCVVFLKSVDYTSVEAIRIVDIAETATRILRKCVMEAKYPFGGTGAIGAPESRFYVAVGGLTAIELGKGTVLALP